MEIETDDDILRKVALGGSMDYSVWPSLLVDILARIDKIAHNGFPIPSIPPPSTTPPPPEPRFLAPLPSSDPIEPPQQQADAAATATASASDSQDSSQGTNKENANPSASTGPAPHAPAEAAPADAGTGAATPLEPGTLPPQITDMLAEIRTTLVDGFPEYPPHTIQRLAELVLAPRQHYRSLPSYLHAVDRVVHVTSGNNIYPLPPAIPDMSAMSLLANGVGSRGPGDDSGRNSMTWANASAGAAVGSDEALGGALLTPIPWLQRRANGGSDASPSPSPPVSEGSVAAQSLSPSGAQASQQRAAQGGAAASSSSAAASAAAGAGPAGPSSSAAGRQFEGQVRTESTETIDGPNGIGSIETVSISFNGIPSMGAARALTQGEILRQEQRAGVVPVSQLARANAAMTATASATASSPLSAVAAPSASALASGPSSSSSAGEPTPTSTGSPSPSPEGAELTPSSADEDMGAAPPGDEVPHARGPEEIGAADTGPQNPTTSPYVVGSGGAVEMRGIDVEAAVGRRAEPATASHSPDADSSAAAAAAALSPSSSSSKREADEDMELETADAAPAQKKLKEHEGDDIAAGSGPDEAGEPKKDAEGDIELSDEVPGDSTEATGETAGGTDRGGGEESKG